MEDFIYGKLNTEKIVNDYTGVDTNTVKLNIDNNENTISANVKKTPGKLILKKYGNIIDEFDGSEDKEIEIPDNKLVDSDTTDIEIDNVNQSVKVNVKKVPNALKIKLPNTEEFIEFDGSQDGIEVDLSDLDNYVQKDNFNGTYISDIEENLDNTATKNNITLHRNGITLKSNINFNSIDSNGSILNITPNNITYTKDTGETGEILNTSDVVNNLNRNTENKIPNTKAVLDANDIIINKVNVNENKINVNTSNITNLQSLTAQHTTTISNINSWVTTNRNDIDSIQSKIPTQASAENKLVSDDMLKDAMTTLSANFRGSWNNWEDVPVHAVDYPTDSSGSKIPTENDFIVIQDASDYHADEIFTRTGETIGYSINEEGQILENSNFAYSDKLYIPDDRDRWIKFTTKGPSSTICRIHAYNDNDIWLEQIDYLMIDQSGEITIVGKIPEDTSYLRVSYNIMITDSFLYIHEILGTWLFRYTGNWGVNGKNGWEHAFQLSTSPFNSAQLNAINSGITAELVEKIGKSAIEVAYNNLPQATAESSDMVMLKNRYNKTLGLYLKFEEPDVVKDEDNLIINTYEDVIRQGDTLIFGKKALITEDGDTLVIRVYNNITEEDDTLIFGGEDN